MVWGDCQTLSEIGYEYLPTPAKDSRAGGARAMMYWASTEKAEDPEARAAFGAGRRHHL